MIKVIDKIMKYVTRYLIYAILGWSIPFTVINITNGAYDIGYWVLTAILLLLYTGYMTARDYVYFKYEEWNKQ